MNTAVSVASLASASAIASPSIAGMSAPEVSDPIFRAIEDHKTKFMDAQKAARVRFETVDAKWSPDYDAAKLNAANAADTTAMAAAEEAAMALTEIRPTTSAGLIALLDHVAAFNAGKLALEADPTGWYSSADLWPHLTDGVAADSDVFGFALLENVRNSLGTTMETHSLSFSAYTARPLIKAASNSADDMLHRCIDCHRSAHSEFAALLAEKSIYEQLCFDQGKKPDARYDLREQALGEAEYDAMWDLIATVPQSAAGLAAMLAYVREADLISAFADDDLAMLHCSIETAVCNLAGLPTPPLAAAFA
jgi:hypothetical protein